MRPKLILGAVVVTGALSLAAGPAAAGHGHFVVIDNPGTGTTTCQYVGHGQTSIDDADHGGRHRIHDNVHTGQPGTDGRGTTFDKHDHLGNHDCDVVRGAR